jgi:hypothetical protein
MILKIFLPKNLAKILAFFVQTTARFNKHLIITLVFEKNANFLQKIGKNRRKLAKIAENCDRNIDPRSPCLESSSTWQRPFVQCHHFPTIAEMRSLRSLSITLGSSVTGRFVEKSAKFRPK